MVERPTKAKVWLSLYLDSESPRTFLNRAESARQSGIDTDDYRKAGSYYYRYWKKAIRNWVDERGLSEAALREKLVKLIHGHTTELKVIEGVIEEDTMPSCCRILIKSAKMDKDGVVQRSSLVEITRENPEVQRRALDMAYKAAGMYAPEKVDAKVTADVATTGAITMDITGLRKAIARADE